MNWMQWRNYLWIEYFLDLAWAFGICAVLSIAVNLLSRASVENHVKILLLLFGVAALGATAGFAGGMSREPTVGLIIPAALTLVGGIAIYLFGVDTTKGAGVSLTAGCFALALFLTYASSAQLRSVIDGRETLRSQCVAAYTNPAIVGTKDAFDRFEAKLKDHCEGGLAWE